MNELSASTDAPPPPPPPPPPDDGPKTPDVSPELANALPHENQDAGRSQSDGSAPDDAMARAQTEGTALREADVELAGQDTSDQTQQPTTTDSHPHDDNTPKTLEQTQTEGTAPQEAGVKLTDQNTPDVSPELANALPHENQDAGRSQPEGDAPDDAMTRAQEQARTEGDTPQAAGVELADQDTSGEVTGTTDTITDGNQQPVGSGSTRDDVAADVLDQAQAEGDKLKTAEVELADVDTANVSPDLPNALRGENQDADLPQSGNGQQGDATAALGTLGEQTAPAGEQLQTATVVEHAADNGAGGTTDGLDTTQPDDKSGVTGLDKSDLPADGTRMSTGEALDAAQKYLGDGYTQPVPGSGRFVSADGTRVVRMGDSDITGAHGPGPHMNFEVHAPNPLKPGKMMITQNNHIILTD